MGENTSIYISAVAYFMDKPPQGAQKKSVLANSPIKLQGGGHRFQTGLHPLLEINVSVPLAG